MAAAPSCGVCIGATVRRFDCGVVIPARPGYGKGQRPLSRNELCAIMHVVYPLASLLRYLCAVYLAAAADGCREIMTVTGGASYFDGKDKGRHTYGRRNAT